MGSRHERDRNGACAQNRLSRVTIILDNLGVRRYCPFVIQTGGIMSGILYLAGTLPWAKRDWVVYDRHATGLFVSGDKNLPPTRWWNRSMMRWWAVMYVAIVRPDASSLKRGEFRIGVARRNCAPMLSTTCFRRRDLVSPRFAIPLFRESAIVFLTDPSGTEEMGLDQTIKIQTLDSAKADGILVLGI